jgi:hypothetical protein
MDEANYTFSQKTIDDYRIQKNSYITDDNVTIFIHGSVRQNESLALESKDQNQVLYMDVGRWGGDEPTGDAWTRQRNFGLVCGSVAVLCNYQNPYNPYIYGSANLNNVDQAMLNNNDFQNIQPLLEKLSESNILGPVTVVKALDLNDKKAEPPCSSEIFVFLGDIHAPVMNFSDRTYLQDPLVSKSCAWRRERVIPDVLEEELTKLFDDITKHSNEITAVDFEIEAVDLTPLIKLLLEKLNFDQVKTWDDEKIKGSDADNWFKHYSKADIFQNAGQDLIHFINLLLDYQKIISASKATLVQLGDLYDFWIGLKWVPNGNMQSGSKPAIQNFLQFWRNETLNRTSASSAICDLLNNTQDLPHVFVYGNHDNCRAAQLGIWNYEKSLENFTTPTGIWAEHGHQGDIFNQDSNSIIGWTCAQSGFFIPGTRNLEDFLRNTLSFLFKTLCQRLIHIRRAACLCQQENKRIYVMGHTHEPLLKRVLVVEQ